jgi:hypothetical protein
MAEAVPPQVVGTNINLIMRGAPDIGAGGLLRFYLAHVFMLPLLTVVFLGVHYYKVVLHGASLPPREEEIGQDTAKRIPMDRRVYFTPDIITSEIMWFGCATFLMVVLCVWFFHAPLEHHANPGVTPLHTTAPWYFLWLQGLLKLGDKTLMGVILPGILLALYFVFPYLDTTASRRYAHRKFALSLSLLFITAMLVLSYMGTPKYGVNTAGDQEIAQSLAPVEGVGPLRAVPFDQMAVGTYCTDNIDKEHKLAIREQAAPTNATAPLPDTFTNDVTCKAAPAGELHALMEEYQKLVDQYDAALPSAVGLLTIADNQSNTDSKNDLKRLDVKVIWQVPEVDAAKHPLKNDDGSFKLHMVTLDVPEKNADGSPKVDANNLPIIDKVNTAQVTSSGKTLYVNRASEYHDNGE